MEWLAKLWVVLHKAYFFTLTTILVRVSIHNCPPVCPLTLCKSSGSKCILNKVNQMLFSISASSCKRLLLSD